MVRHHINLVYRSWQQTRPSTPKLLMTAGLTWAVFRNTFLSPRIMTETADTLDLQTINFGLVNRTTLVKHYPTTHQSMPLSLWSLRRVIVVPLRRKT